VRLVGSMSNWTKMCGIQGIKIRSFQKLGDTRRTLKRCRAGRLNILHLDSFLKKCPLYPRIRIYSSGRKRVTTKGVYTFSKAPSIKSVNSYVRSSTPFCLDKSKDCENNLLVIKCVYHFFLQIIFKYKFYWMFSVHFYNNLNNIL
jgi:hypothetical protein